MSQEIRVPRWMHEDPIKTYGKRAWRSKDNAVYYLEGAHSADIQPQAHGLAHSASRVCLCARELTELAALIDDCTNGKRCRDD